MLVLDYYYFIRVLYVDLDWHSWCFHWWYFWWIVQIYLYNDYFIWDSFISIYIIVFISIVIFIFIFHFVNVHILFMFPFNFITFAYYLSILTLYYSDIVVLFHLVIHLIILIFSLHSHLDHHLLLFRTFSPLQYHWSSKLKIEDIIIFYLHFMLLLLLIYYWYYQ